MKENQHSWIHTAKVDQLEVEVRLSAQDLFKTSQWVASGKVNACEHDVRITVDTRVVMLNVNNTSVINK